MSVVQVIIVVTLCYQLSVFSAPSDTPKRALDLGTVERVRRYSEFLVRRSNWNSPDFKVPCPVTLQFPVTKVYVKETVSTNCYNFSQCKDRMLERQRWYYSFYRTDIQANFVIGGDGSIFEGLSWDCRVTYMVPDRNSILVLLIGCSECHDGDNDGQYNFQEVQYRTLDVFLKACLTCCSFIDSETTATDVNDTAADTTTADNTTTDNSMQTYDKNSTEECAVEKLEWLEKSNFPERNGYRTEDKIYIHPYRHYRHNSYLHPYFQRDGETGYDQNDWYQLQYFWL